MTAPDWAEPTVPVDQTGRVDPTTLRPGRPPGERGQTVIGPAVVTTIAARAALRVPGVMRSEPSALAKVFKVNEAGIPGASARIEEGRATVQLKVTMSYPTPVWSTSDEIRRSVRTDVERFTGLSVGEIDLEVSVARRPVISRRVV